MSEHGLSKYLKAAKNHSNNYKTELDELRADLLKGNFVARDYRATERLLQVYVELCIGLAKHWSRQLSQSDMIDAYQTFSHLREANKITSDELSNWRKIIGLRNGLVHDYLNVDLGIIEGIVTQQKYNDLQDFVDIAIKALQVGNGSKG